MYLLSIIALLHQRGKESISPTALRVWLEFAAKGNNQNNRSTYNTQCILVNQAKGQAHIRSEAQTQGFIVLLNHYRMQMVPPNAEKMIVM
jgi:hypothetical protein